MDEVRIQSAVEAARKFIVNFGTKDGVTPADLAKWCFEYSKLTPEERERANVQLCVKRFGVAYTEKYGDFIYYPTRVAPADAL